MFDLEISNFTQEEEEEQEEEEFHPRTEYHVLKRLSPLQFFIFLDF